MEGSTAAKKKPEYDLYEQSPPVSEGLLLESYNQTFNPKGDPSLQLRMIDA